MARANSRCHFQHLHRYYMCDEIYAVRVKQGEIILGRRIDSWLRARETRNDDDAQALLEEP